MKRWIIKNKMYGDVYIVKATSGNQALLILMKTMYSNVTEADLEFLHITYTVTQVRFMRGNNVIKV